MSQRAATVGEPAAPRYVVWELTLACDLACRHCGSRAGKARPAELTKAQALDVVAQLAAMGTYEVTFIGGEAYLYPDWLDIVRAAAAAGIRCGMTTGARGVDAALARQARDAGLEVMSVSIDGLEATHDALRAVRGSWRRAVEALGHIAAAGMRAQANTQWNRKNLPEVEALGAVLLDAGARTWQIQVTGPMGRAADHAEWLLEPADMLDLVPRLGRFAQQHLGRITLHAANNLGYFGPWEHVLRNGHHFQGCTAGRYVLGIEADGSVKGCPSLPSGPYVGGTLAERPLREIWEETAPLRFTRERDLAELWGRCASCYYRDVCQGGCSWTAHTLLGRRGNMPYCYHRADTLRDQGLRERLRQVQAAPGEPFDFGRFELYEEPWSG